MTERRTAEQIQTDYDRIIQQASLQPGVAEAVALYERAERIETGIVAIYSYGVTVTGSTNSNALTRQ